MAFARVHTHELKGFARVYHCVLMYHCVPLSTYELKGFARVYHCAISELCKGLYHYNLWGLTRVHTSSDSPVSTTGASAAAWSKPSSPTLKGDGEVTGRAV